MSAEYTVVMSPFGDWWVVPRDGSPIRRYPNRADAEAVAA